MSLTANSIVLNWLNNEINLNPNVDNIQMEFRNGYRFGDILLNLKLISKKEFNLFKDSAKIEDIKNNFILLKNFLHSLLNLEIRMEEFDEIIKNNKYKSTIIIYRLKNAFYKNNIHFNEIKTYIFPPSQEEMEEKIKNIMEINFDDEKDEKNNDTIFYKDRKKAIQNLRKEQSCRSILSSNLEQDFNEINKHINIKKSTDNKSNPINLSKFKEINNIQKAIILPVIFERNKRNDSELKIDKQKKAKTLFKNKSQLNLNINKNINNIMKMNMYSSLSFEGNFNNEIPIDKNKLTNNLIQYGINYENIKNNSSLNDLFQKKDISIRNNKNNLRKKIVLKKIKDNVFDAPEVNFIKKDKKFLDNIKNILNNSKNAQSNLENNFILFNRMENSKYQTSKKRKEYTKMRENEVENEKYLKRILFFDRLKISHQLKENLSQKNLFKSIYFSKPNIIFNNKEEKFDKNKYYEELNKLNFKEFNEYCKNRYDIYKDYFFYMKNILQFIIDISMEVYTFQKENKTEFLDNKLYLRFIKYFLKNKKIRRPKVDNEYNKIKEIGKIEENIDADKILLSDDEIFLLKDYLYYIGFWNKEKIMDNELIGKKLDYKLILVNKIKNLSRFEEYEPTKTENEDLTLPLNNINNYNYGDLILKIVENRYSNKSEMNNNNEKSISKWNYIPYKISLIGYPFSGKKSISEKIINKFPNLKIYSVQKLLREYIYQYKAMTEPSENSIKSKSKKLNKTEELKIEKQKQLDEFEPILKIIKPYIDLLENKNSGNNNEINKNDICIPQDEVLLNLIIYTIEKDFNKKEIDNEINENKKRIVNILNKIEAIQNNKNEKKEKVKKEKSKNNQKEKNEKEILNLENEIKKIKLETVKGFILVDFPTNFNQCYLLENYLTGYIDELQKPKTLKNKTIQKLNSILEMKYQPNENKYYKKAGIDFIIDINLKEEEVNNRFNNIKYDPIEDKLYSQSEYEQINNKKILDRIKNEIPYFNKSIFNYYKKEYEENISQINMFYNKFGFIPDKNNDYNNNNAISLFTNENDQNNKVIKVYQSINPEKEIINNINQDLNIIENSKENSNKKSKNKPSQKINLKVSKKIKNNKKSLKNENTNENKEINKNEKNLTIKDKNEQIMVNIYEFITNKIKILFEENNKNDILLNNEYNKDLEDRSQNSSERRKSKTKRQTALMVENDRIILNIKLKSDNIINEIIFLDSYYNKNLKIFIYLLNKQRFDIYERLNLIQKKFRDFLNRETDKKKVIHIYISKYNNFFKNNPDLLMNERVKIEFLNDIEDINVNLWSILINKKNESINELQEIKNCGFIEIELCKFYNQIKELFITEAHKFLNMLNIILDFYIKNVLDERINFIKKNINIATNISNNIGEIIRLRNKINEYNESKIFKEEYIFNNLIPINDYFFKEIKRLDNNDLNNSNKDAINNNDDIEQINFDNRSKYSIFSDNILYILIKNINNLFFNSIHLLINQNEKIIPFFQILTEINNIFNRKNRAKAKKSQIIVNETLSSNSSHNKKKEYNILVNEENIKKIIQNEKNKYKYRLCFIKSFATKFILIISKISQNIFNNLDEWIIKSVNMENEAQNEIINIFKNKLEENQLIDEENEIKTIEMDCFEKIIEEDDKSNKSIELKLKPIDNSSVINSNRFYNKINIDFLIKDNFFDIKIEKIQKKEKVEKNEDKKENMIYDFDDIKQYKIILPKNICNCISSEISERSFATNEEEMIKEIKEEEFYFDINKFFEIYQKIKKFEIEKNIVSYDNFFEVFIKQYIIYNIEENKNSENIENENEMDNYEENNNSNKPKKIINAIADILTHLNSKQIKRLISFYQIHIEKNENDKEDNEYEEYIKLDEIFTMISLIGCEILTKEKEEEIMNYLKDKLIHEKYLDKNEFIKCNFWFEKNFEYQKKIRNELKEEETKEIMNIKNLLFEIWKEELSNAINIKKFLEVLKINKYITDLDEYTNKKYYDIILYG